LQLGALLRPRRLGQHIVGGRVQRGILVKAWLVTWEGDGERAKVKIKNRIAAILNSRTSAERVRELVEFIYVNEWYSVSERLAYAKSRRGTPYPAQFTSISGVQWEGQIFCGDNPFLFARIVEDIHVEDAATSEGKLLWRERSPDEIKRIEEAIRKIKGDASS
jgi:hypothetical protein